MFYWAKVKAKYSVFAGKTVDPNRALSTQYFAINIKRCVNWRTVSSLTGATGQIESNVTTAVLFFFRSPFVLTMLRLKCDSCLPSRETITKSDPRTRKTHARLHHSLKSHPTTTTKRHTISNEQEKKNASRHKLDIALAADKRLNWIGYITLSHSADDIPSWHNFYEWISVCRSVCDCVDAISNEMSSIQNEPRTLQAMNH